MDFVTAHTIMWHGKTRPNGSNNNGNCASSMHFMDRTQLVISRFAFRFRFGFGEFLFVSPFAVALAQCGCTSAALKAIAHPILVCRIRVPFGPVCASACKWIHFMRCIVFKRWFYGCGYRCRPSTALQNVFNMRWMHSNIAEFWAVALIDNCYSFFPLSSAGHCVRVCVRARALIIHVEHWNQSEMNAEKRKKSDFLARSVNEPERFGPQRLCCEMDAHKLPVRRMGDGQQAIEIFNLLSVRIVAHLCGYLCCSNSSFNEKNSNDKSANGWRKQRAHLCCELNVNCIDYNDKYDNGNNTEHNEMILSKQNTPRMIYSKHVFLSLSVDAHSINTSFSHITRNLLAIISVYYRCICFSSANPFLASQLSASCLFGTPTVWLL